jgi:hypothetical protein
MITLEKIVESLKLQLKPHLTDDQIVHDEWLIEMINTSRAAMCRSLYVSGEVFTAFFQKITGNVETLDLDYKKFTMPSKLMEGIGRRNVRYFGPIGTKNPDFHYCSFEELVNYESHRFGIDQPAFANLGDILQIKAPNMSAIELHAVIEAPNSLADYSYETSSYPIGENNERQLEIITFQHIAAKLGMPVDFANNGIDETKNIPVKQPQQQQQQQDNGGQ